jgi:hypothetical protein
LVAAEDREADVERVYGSSGIWSELLSRADGYLGSELICESKVQRRYLAFDYWTSHFEFEAFRVKHQVALERFTELLVFEGLLQREVFLGSYYESDSDEGSDIVPV